MPSVRSLTENYRALRTRSMWSLLASDTAPETVACLQLLLFEAGERLPLSVFVDRLKLFLNELSVESIDNQQVQAKVNQWRVSGFIAIRYSAGQKDDPWVELTAAAHEAISFIASQGGNRTSPTESRLELLIHSIKKLVMDTDLNAKDRIARLKKEKERINEQIKQIKAGRLEVANDTEIKAQVYDLMEMLENLNGDFYRIRDRFRELSMKLHEDIMRNEGSVGGILGNFFTGYDAIANSDEGKTFNAFYDFLNSAEEMAQIDDSIDALQERSFWMQLTDRERRNVLNMRRNLNDRARETQAVMRLLAGSLKHLVQSSDYKQNRRMRELLADAKREALAARETFSYSSAVFELPQSTASIASSAALDLYDPETEATPEAMQMAQADMVDLQALARRVEAADINFPRLKRQLKDVLSHREVASIADVLGQYPAEQGLASVVGLMSLAVRFGAEIAPDRTEAVAWKDRFGTEVRAHLPMLLFTQETLKRLTESEASLAA
ncbi:MAG TPA: DUF3375 domain-containing protein [Candidatus Aphodousia gallistercoris]|nr:DUF3375 domain-containing protein [Candidatus Aphodousia gallistercoris]